MTEVPSVVPHFINRLRANVKYARDLKYSVTQLATLSNEEAEALAEWMQSHMEAPTRKTAPAIKKLEWVRGSGQSTGVGGVQSAFDGGVTYEVACDQKTGSWFWSWSLDGTTECNNATSEEDAKAKADECNVKWRRSHDSGNAEQFRALLVEECDNLLHVALHSPFWGEYHRTYITGMREKIATFTTSDEEGDEE